MSKVLVVGSGGREHALAWKLAQSEKVDTVFVAPGNAGMVDVAQCVDIKVDDISGLLAFARQEAIDLTVVGPELPLTLGIVDAFREAGLVIFGPSRKAAQLEGSKIFAKRLMEDAGIPTARYAAFDNLDGAAQYARAAFTGGRPVVVKADGLAAGKGVVVPETPQEALAALNEIMVESKVGEAGKQVVLEERLEGEEVSVFALCDGEHLAYLVSAQDHKRVFDGDQGPNTGGMGAYTHPPVYTPDIHERVIKEVLWPTVDTMRAQGVPYTGVIYAGLMLTADGPRVLEYNVRFGDPECQAIMALLESDLYDLLYAASTGRLNEVEARFAPGTAACVVMAAAGYPESPRKGDVINIDKVEDALVFHAGTALVDGRLVSAGGRVLNVVATGKELSQALARAYHQVEHIHFAGAHYRKDIGHRALK